MSSSRRLLAIAPSSSSPLTSLLSLAFPNSAPSTLQTRTIVCTPDHTTQTTSAAPRHGPTSPSSPPLPLSFAFASRPLLRPFSSSSVSDPHHGMTEAEYNKIADSALDDIHEKLEVYLEDQDKVDADVEYSMGVLTVKLGQLGTFVINKQTPNRQIWMSSPVSGPVRYDLEGGSRWVYRRDGHELRDRLQKEVGDLVGEPLKL